MKVLIAGAGFAGLRLARKLNNQPGIEVLLIDRFNYHQFQPLFYQVATAGLDASNISFPLRKVFHKSKNVRIRMAEIMGIDTQKNEVKTDVGIFDYDKLVLATGADTNFFGNEELKAHALPMKSTVEALQLRHRLIHNFEDALQVNDPVLLQRLMNVVIVGAGPTGVELSGAIAELKQNVLPKDYPDLDFSRMKIMLLEGSDRTLAAMSAKSSEKSRKYLENLGVEVMTNALVERYDGKNVTLTDGRNIPASLVVWAAGIKGNIPNGIENAVVMRGNRLKVDRYNRVEGTNNIFALGDVAYMETQLYPNGHPQVANVAVTQAENLAHNLTGLLRQQPEKPYEYYDKGSMATVGKHLAVVDIPKPKLHFGGGFAWFIWMSLHLLLLVGVKNRIQVFINWVYNYFTSDQNLRLIFKEFYKESPIDTEVKAAAAAATHPAPKQSKLQAPVLVA
ncbi:MAG: NAD(P)/FAD-dependent oxidoreductase [Chitinophagaceae bacterium]|jgi:NADH dehydrogenase|nr:NAD(P)/FAD-dependent oxidoreductase [Chitinophagaceae bacterium]